MNSKTSDRPSDPSPAPVGDVREAAQRCANELVDVVETAWRVAKRTAPEMTFVLDRQRIAGLIAGHFSALTAGEKAGAVATVPPDELTRENIRTRAAKLIAAKGWKPGSNISLHSAIELLTAFGMELSRKPETDRCAYPECGCDFDEICNERVKALTTPATSRDRLAREALEEIRDMTDDLRLVDRLAEIEKVATAALQALGGSHE